MSYWDTSSLVKLYVQETDAGQFEALALTAGVATGAIALHEARTVFRRREAEGVIPAGEGAALFQRLTAHTALGRVRVQPETEAVGREFGVVLEKCFSQVPPVFLRTNDALHLASAKVAGETVFVTADARQRTAALLMGFKVLP